ncbi:hypothetical protein [uncultured Rikenella sp.]|uniref:hypothetical protein n=1 Tax=uncultured Rikenella sp. TaxID=368003 RepID=UPI0026124B1B|nr:hypothetical protein [uncultured Rikenella sp.]
MPLGINGCRSAPGYRRGPSGALKHIGSHGYGWSSAVSGTNGVNFSFSPSWLFSNGSDYRAHCFPLHCLSE